MAGIEKVAVIGAGVMGAGIAAHVANAGIPVVLLDIVPPGAANRFPPCTSPPLPMACACRCVPALRKRNVPNGPWRGLA